MTKGKNINYVCETKENMHNKSVVKMLFKEKLPQREFCICEAFENAFWGIPESPN